MNSAEYVQLTGFPVLPGRPGAPTGPGDPCSGINQVRYNLPQPFFMDVMPHYIWGALRDSNSNSNLIVT